jgi:hypothetical protein
MFRLEKQQALLSNFNPRAEKHGQENVPAGDLKIAVTCHNSVLEEFAPHLRELLFCHPSEAGPAAGLRLPVDDDKRYTALRFPKIGPLKLDEAFPGYSLSIAGGMGLRKPLELDDVELDGFTFEPQEGGSVTVSFRAKCHPDDREAGRLCAMIQEAIVLTLTPPSAEQRAQAAEAAGQETLALEAPPSEEGDATADAAASAIAAHVEPALKHAIIERVAVAEDTSTNLWTHVVTFTDGTEVTLQKYAYRLSADEIIDDLAEYHDYEASFTPDSLAAYEPEEEEAQPAE